MPHMRMQYLCREKTRHGRYVWYFRRDKQSKRTRVKGDFGSTEFLASYAAALSGKGDTLEVKTPENTLLWLVERYMQSPEWAATAAETRKQFSYQFTRMTQKTPDAPIREITRKHIMDGRDRRHATPTDANKFVRASRKLFNWAVERELVEANPAAGVKLLTLPNSATGFHTWTDEECVKYEAQWPVGTRQRLAFDILLYTGLRRSDAVRIGPQHVKEGVIEIKTEKTGEAVYIPLLPPLLKSIASCKTGAESYLVTSNNKPFVKESFGNWFKKACVAANVPGAAHGLRKAGAVRAAENGASESQLNSIFGWSEGSRESATYTRKASRAKMAKESVKLLMKREDI